MPDRIFLTEEQKEEFRKGRAMLRSMSFYHKVIDGYIYIKYYNYSTNFIDENWNDSAYMNNIDNLFHENIFYQFIPIKWSVRYVE